MAYCSKEAHSCVEKAAMIGFVKLRILEPDENCSLRGYTLREVCQIFRLCNSPLKCYFNIRSHICYKQLKEKSLIVNFSLPLFVICVVFCLLKRKSYIFSPLIIVVWMVLIASHLTKLKNITKRFIIQSPKWANIDS